jgi:hypothetical protein
VLDEPDYVSSEPNSMPFEGAGEKLIESEESVVVGREQEIANHLRGMDQTIR